MEKEIISRIQDQVQPLYQALTSICRCSGGKNKMVMQCSICHALQEGQKLSGESERMWMLSSRKLWDCRAHGCGSNSKKDRHQTAPSGTFAGFFNSSIISVNLSFISNGAKCCMAYSFLSLVFPSSMNSNTSSFLIVPFLVGYTF